MKRIFLSLAAILFFLTGYAGADTGWEAAQRTENGAGLATSQVIVSSNSVGQLVTGSTKNACIKIRNIGAGAVYISSGSAVTTSTGYSIGTATTTANTFEIGNYTGSIWAIADSNVASSTTVTIAICRTNQ